MYQWLNKFAENFIFWTNLFDRAIIRIVAWRWNSNILRKKTENNKTNSKVKNSWRDSFIPFIRKRKVLLRNNEKKSVCVWRRIMRYWSLLRWHLLWWYVDALHYLNFYFSHLEIFTDDACRHFLWLLFAKFAKNGLLIANEWTVKKEKRQK